jgi:hypothetical protein
MKRINFPFVAGLLLAAISLFFSATGLVHLFAGACMAIMVMAGAFEFAKIVLTVQLVRHGWRRVLAFPQAIALLCLTAISSIGVYGYLGRAYNVGHKAATVGAGSITALEQQVNALETDRDRLYAQIEAIPAAQGTNRRRLTTTLHPQLQALDASIQSKRDSLTRVRTAQVGHETDVGELRYAADLLGLSQEGLARWVITVLAFLLDPLAVLLVTASGVKRRQTTDEWMHERWSESVPGTCTLPVERGKPGWFCTRDAGHEGPCAAVPHDPSLLPGRLGKPDTIESTLDRPDSLHSARDALRERDFVRINDSKDRVAALQAVVHSREENGLSPGLNQAIRKHKKNGGKVVANNKPHV